MFKKLINKTIIKNILFMIVLYSMVLFLSKLSYSTPCYNYSHQNVLTTNKINSDNTGQIPIGTGGNGPYENIDDNIFDNKDEQHPSLVNVMFQDHNNTLYVGGYDLGEDGVHSFYSSQDGGQNWMPIEDGNNIFDGKNKFANTQSVINTMFQDDKGTLYVGGNGLGKDGKHSFYSSQDGGQNWIPFGGEDFDTNFAEVTTIFQYNNKILYVGGSRLGKDGRQQHSFYSSTDGENWNAVEDNKKRFNSGGGVNIIFQDKSTKTLYVGGVGLGTGDQTYTLYKSTDGNNWTGVGSDFYVKEGQVNTMFQDHNNTLYVGGYDLGEDGVHSFYSSQDGGTSWKPVEDDKDIFNKGGTVETIFEDQNTKTLYVGGHHLGDHKHTFYSSKNEKWDPVDDTDSNFNKGGTVKTILRDKNTKTLYAGGEELGGDQNSFYSSSIQSLNINVTIDNSNNYNPYEHKNSNNTEYVFKDDITISFNDIFKTLEKNHLQDEYFLTINDSKQINDTNYQKTGYKLPSKVYPNNNNKYNIKLYSNNNAQQPLKTIAIWIKKLITTPDDSYFHGCQNIPNTSYNVYFKNDNSEKKYSYIFDYQDSTNDAAIDFNIQSYNTFIDSTIKYSSSSTSLDGSYYAIIKDGINPSIKGITNANNPVIFNEPNHQELLYDLHLVDQVGNSKDIIIQVGGSKVDPRLIIEIKTSNIPNKTNKPIPTAIVAIAIGASVTGVLGFVLIGVMIYKNRKYSKYKNI